VPPALQSATLARACLVLNTSLWSYNALLSCWEPVVEPMQLILHHDANSSTMPVAGVQPGSWLRVNSSDSCVHVTLAYAAINSLIEAMEDWNRLEQLKGEGWWWWWWCA
jgi:hypothetical protein